VWVVPGARPVALACVSLAVVLTLWLVTTTIPITRTLVVVPSLFCLLLLPRLVLWTLLVLVGVP
jgi:hypothetical protein